MNNYYEKRKNKQFYNGESKATLRFTVDARNRSKYAILHTRMTY